MNDFICHFLSQEIPLGLKQGRCIGPHYLCLKLIFYLIERVTKIKLMNTWLMSTGSVDSVQVHPTHLLKLNLYLEDDRGSSIEL